MRGKMATQLDAPDTDTHNGPKIGRVLSAMFLVAGTCIGGGMLALPVATGVSGFLPSIVLMVVCWLMMTATALLLLEVSLWMEEGVHIITMTSRLLGPFGKWMSWFLYLFICYASLVAYTAGGGVQIAAAAREYLSVFFHKDMGALLFVVLFGGTIYLGSRIVGRVNFILFIAMLVAYAALVGMGISEVQPELLATRKWSGSLMAIPLLLTSFSFQTMVPSLTPYLKRNIKALRWSVIGGTSLAFLFYAIWQVLILGIVPVEGPNGLAQALQLGEPATQFLREHVEGQWVVPIAQFFALFAIITSFLGIAFGLYDFLADGLNIKKQGIGKVILGLLIVLPTLFFAIRFERVFLLALEVSGGYGDSILNGLIPVAMVWVGRYSLKMSGANSFKLPGGKPLLVALFISFLFTLVLEIAMQTGQMSELYEPFEVPAHNVIPLQDQTKP